MFNYLLFCFVELVVAFGYFNFDIREHLLLLLILFLLCIDIIVKLQCFFLLCFCGLLLLSTSSCEFSCAILYSNWLIFELKICFSLLLYSGGCIFYMQIILLQIMYVFKSSCKTFILAWVYLVWILFHFGSCLRNNNLFYQSKYLQV